MAGGLVIDYYYEFAENIRLFDQPVRYGLQRGYHPEESDQYQRMLHSHCYIQARRIWLENANGMVLVRCNGRDVHEQTDSREMTWIKLLAREL
jgi:hypothetical protein